MGHSIYLADDEKSIRELLHSFLASDGYTVRSFESGDALLEAFRQEPAELVILDIMMPGTDGLAVCRELRSVSCLLYTSEHLTSNGKVNYKLGDTVTLDVGDRMLDGRRLGQGTPVYTYDSETQVEVMSGERLENTEPRTYTVVGIYERPAFEDYSAPGYTALTAADPKSAEQSPIHCYFKLHKPAGVYDFMKEMGYTQEYRYAYNTKVLLYSCTARFDSFLTAFYSLAAIIIALIVFGSVSLIYNAFSISVSERTRQFGLLSSVGATKKQLRRMVLFEALAVSAVGIPLGILVGIGGIGITLLLIGDKFFSIVRVDIPMRLCVSWQAVVIAAVIALVTVLISAWIPSKRATSVSAVEAIRQSMDIKVSGRPVRTSTLAYKLFGLPSVLAGKHYKRCLLYTSRCV